MIFIGLDDTDTLESRGTGHLARQIAAALAADYVLLGVTRHQLLVDPRVPCTKNNSCAAIALDGNGKLDPAALLERVRALMLDDFQPGSDPGLCVAGAAPGAVPGAVSEFGRRVQRYLVSQSEARAVAAAHGIPLLGLGGDEDGVIGALAAVGLAATGEDGRYVLIGRSRELSGLQPVSALLAAGIAAVQTADGQAVTEGLVQTDRLRPARRGSRPIAVVEWCGDHWLPLKLD
jgi:tRNA(Ile2) C34 agmatinyltransferase TiaS